MDNSRPIGLAKRLYVSGALAAFTGQLLGGPTDVGAVAGKTDASSTTLTLGQAKSIAFARNWDLLASQSGVDLAVAQSIMAREFPNPTLSYSTAKLDPEGNGTVTGNSLGDRSYDTIFALTQLIEIGGKRSNRQASARAGLAGARARFEEARRLLDLGVTKGYIAALLAGSNEKVLGDSAQSLRHEAEIAQVRFRAGDISESDLKQIQNNASVFELQASSASSSAAQARIALEVLLGVKQPRGRWEPAETLDRVVEELSPPAAKSDGDRPDVLAAEADLQKSQADLRLQRAIRIPDPTFLVQYEHNPPGPPGPDTLGFGVSFPLPIWNRNRGAILAAERVREQAELSVNKARAQAVADLAVADCTWNEARDRLQRYQSQIQPNSDKVRLAVAFSFEKGGASLVDLLTAERDDNAVRLATAQAQADAAGALADLIAARYAMLQTELNAKE
jgi:cobalt-zinc-cadmium efflux system outer membrane protein